MASCWPIWLDRNNLFLEVGLRVVPRIFGVRLGFGWLFGYPMLKNLRIVFSLILLRGWHLYSLFTVNLYTFFIINKSSVSYPKK